jgi:hypothetical protein
MHMAIKHPEKRAAQGIEIIHPIQIKANTRQFTAFKFPLQRPTAIVAPVIQCVVLTGNSNPVPIKIDTIEPNSAQNPRDGESLVIFEPRFDMIRHPRKNKPISIPAPPYANIHTGTSTLKMIVNINILR